jgi:lipopolysaccharide export system protein LptA
MSSSKKSRSPASAWCGRRLPPTPPGRLVKASSRVTVALGPVLLSGLIGWVSIAHALEPDRQQPLEVNADSTGGTLGDGVTTLKGHVEIRQGSLLIRADEAEVDKVDGKVRQIKLRGDKAFLAQEIEEQGVVEAWAESIDYQVGSGVVNFHGDARVRHPQYEISGDFLTYDLIAQHFRGTGDESGNGRIHIRLDPEVTAEDPDGRDPDKDPEQGDEPHGEGDGP